MTLLDYPNPIAMKEPPKSKNAKIKKPSIDLPEHRIWKQLENFGNATSEEQQTKFACKNVERMSRLLDKAFDLILEKLIRQN